MTVLIAALIVVTACSSAAPERPVEPASPARLMPMPADAADRRSSAAIPEAACPTKIPFGTHIRDSLRIVPPKDDFPTFSIEWDAPYPGLTSKNDPPRFVHLVVHASAGADATEDWPVAERGERGMQKTRKKAIVLGHPEWAGRDGTLLLAPSYPFGGIDGDHVVFAWKEDGSPFTVSLHAWRPLAEAVATLEEVVRSLPR